MAKIVDINRLIKEVREYRDSHLDNIAEYKEKLEKGVVWANQWLESAMISENVIDGLGKLPDLDEETCKFSLNELIVFISQDVVSYVNKLIDLRSWEHNSTSYMSNFNNLCKCSAYSNLIKFFNRLVYQVNGKFLIEVGIL